MNLDVIFDTLPFAFPVTNFFATAADWKEALKLGDMLVQAQNAVGHLDAGRQLVRVERLGIKSSAPASIASR